MGAILCQGGDGVGDGGSNAAADVGTRHVQALETISGFRSTTIPHPLLIRLYYCTGMEFNIQKRVFREGGWDEGEIKGKTTPCYILPL